MDADLDEQIAWAATPGRAAPEDRRAQRITVDGKTLRFSDAQFDGVLSATRRPPTFDSLNGNAGSLQKQSTGYTAGAIVDGTAVRSARPRAFGRGGTKQDYRGARCIRARRQLRTSSASDRAPARRRGGRSAAAEVGQGLLGAVH